MATSVYDGDGRRVKPVMGSETITFIGAHYEVTNPGSGQTVTKYYFAGAARIAMRKYISPQWMKVEYFLGDHLGSTSLTTDAYGEVISEVRYTAWGEVRDAVQNAPFNTTPSYSLTKYSFTGQFSYMDDPTTGTTEGFGLMFYQSRFYDPSLGRFTQADSIVPGGVQGMDRYAYVNNSPLNYVDPSGHESVCGHANSDPECDGKSDVPLFSSPTLLDRSKLSRERGAKTGVSAYGLYDIYLGLWENRDAWYWGSGHFTLDDFNTLILYHEASTVMGDNKVYPVYQQAWARSFNTWCGGRPDVCVGGSDPASVLTYLSLASESAGAIAKDPSSANEPFFDWENNIVSLSQASPMLQGMSNPLWGEGCVGNTPCYVGNWSLFSPDMAKAASKKPWFFMIWGSGNRMVIMTLCQSYYWDGGYWEKGRNQAFHKAYPAC